MASDTAPKTAEQTGANDEYVDPTGPGGTAPLPPDIRTEDLETARDPEKLAAAREAAADEAGLDQPAGAEPQRLTSGYGDATVEDLEAEVEARRGEGRTIDVKGTGKDGAVVKADLVGALEADDKASAA